MNTAGPSSLRRRWKGKERSRLENVFSQDAEGTGGTGGIVLPMDMVGTGINEVAYTLPLLVSTGNQNLSLQIDTGSSDLWIASRGCSGSSCSGTQGREYDPSISSNSTGKSFSISYLEGNVQGPIVWDTVVVGGYSVDNQALAAATTVNAEPLNYDFDGILGLALPLNSVIAVAIPPVTNNTPDGATFSSNLFGITPHIQAPAAHFFSLVLARPGSDRLPSLFGIGRHPAAIIPDPSQIEYATIVGDADGDYLWKADVRAITVYVAGVAKPVTLPRGRGGTPFPVAVFDTGVPLILTTAAIANGIYGALGIDPASDGQYYVPCKTPLNLTVTLDTRAEIPLHPLDLTAEPADQTNAEYCVGQIQADDAGLADVTSAIDIILGVPFMRNTYTVMAYEIPNANGSFTNDTSNDASDQGVHPRLGLLGLTNATIALSEFHTVRVLNQPLPPSTPAGGESGNSSMATVGGKKMPVGIAVLIGLASFFGLCFALFALRWFITKRKWNRVARHEGLDEAKAGFTGYQLATRSSDHGYDTSEGTLRTTDSNESKKERLLMDRTMSSGRTHVDPDVFDADFAQRPTKRGRRDSHNVNDPWDPRNYSMAFRDSLFEPDEIHHHPRSPSPPLPIRPDHQRTTSELRNAPQAVMLPLLAHTRGDSRGDDLTEFGLVSMIGVGTAARGSKIDSDFRQSVASSASRPRSVSPSGTVRRTSFPPRSSIQSGFGDSLSPPGSRPTSLVHAASPKGDSKS